MLLVIPWGISFSLKSPGYKKQYADIPVIRQVEVCEGCEVAQLGLRQPPDPGVAEVEPLKVGEDGQAPGGQGQGDLDLGVGLQGQVLQARQPRETS